MTADQAGQRIDNFLLREFAGVPRSHVYRLLRSGQVRVDGKRATAELRLALGQDVRLPPVRLPTPGEAVVPPDALIQRLDNARLQEDEHYLVLDKPAGLASHGGSGLPYGVIEVLRSARQGYLELAHRLDRDTSGVLLLAKSRPALLRAQAAFREGAADKRYLGLLEGVLKKPVEIDAALVKGRLKSGERHVVVDDDDGKPARSLMTPLKALRGATFCEIRIYSGRMHQIRVHAAALGHPLAGDGKYAPSEARAHWRSLGLKRLFLHAWRLTLPAADGFAALRLEAALAPELQTVIDTLPPG